jgi:hypothetical protein
MSDPAPAKRPAKLPTQFRGIWVALVYLVPVLSLVWFGMCAGVIALIAHRQKQQQLAAAGVTTWASPGGWTTPPAIRPGVNDWVSRRMFAPAYTAALDAVAADPAVHERIGLSVEPAGQSDELYRRLRTGELSEVERIEFDVRGDKGAIATVTVEVSTRRTDYSTGAYRAKAITVKFADGTELKVEPPAEQPGSEIM